MKLTRSQIKKIILEEHLKDRFITEAMSREKADEVLAWIRGESPRPKWLTDDYGKSGKPKSGQAPMSPGADRSAETMPLPTDDMPQYDDEYDEEGAYDPEAEASVQSPGTDTVDAQERIVNLVQGMPPEEMLDLFTSVIEKLAPEYIEPQRRKIGFREVKYIVQEVLEEVGDYHFGFGDEEKYDALDPHGFNDMDDEEIIDQAERDGIEVHRYLDDDGYIISPEFRLKLIDAIKNV